MTVLTILRLTRSLGMSDHDSSGVNLAGKYRPATLGEVVGQSQAVDALRGFVKQSREAGGTAVFFLAGPTGVGKTAAAWAMAFDLGCSSDWPEMGGVCEVPSGKQDGRAVDDLARSLRLRPLYGSGWKVVIVNEADYMTDQAAGMWLDVLEHLPNRTVVIFTTNRIERLPDRLTSRGEIVQFSGESAEFRRGLVELVKRVWKLETGKALHKVPVDLGRFDLASGTSSIRLALQQIAPFIRAGKPLPESFAVPFIRDEVDGISVSGSAAARKAWDTRRRNGQARVSA